MMHNTFMLSNVIKESLLPLSREDNSWKDMSLLPFFLSIATTWNHKELQI